MSINSIIIRWGILGCGNVTEIKSGPAYHKTEGFEIVAVMRRDATKAADYAKRHGIRKFYTDADDLINDPEIDAIYIATPPDTHKYYGLKVALAGKICCIEKPLSPNYQDSLAIHEAFETKKIPLFVAYYRRWHLSKPTSNQDLSGNYNWRTDAAIANAGYFDDLASHGLDLFVFLLGDIKEASGISLNQQGLYTAKDAVSASWLHESGITGSGSWNFGSYLREDTVEIYGSKGKITFSVFENEPLILKNEQGDTKLYIEHPENIQLYHVQKMKESLLHNAAHPSIGVTAAHTSWVMDKMVGNLAED
jgi:1,5-anhydro-D-fructose reductase (1,5-anhydro-D-mannitol-forming)